MIYCEQFKGNSYGEWLARQNNTSWKAKLCDDIDRIILQDNVKDISDLIKELQNCGYEVTQHKYLSVKPAYLKNRKAVRTLRLGDGYGLEELQYRIENKDIEKKVRILERYDNGCDELIQYKLQLNDLRKKYDKVVSERKEISGNYKTFIRQLESDYEVMLYKAKTELEAYEEELHKPPKREFTDVVRDMSVWAERVIVRERKYKKVETERNIIQPRIYDRQEGR